MLIKMVRDALSSSFTPVSSAAAGAGDMQAAMTLASILKNPTEEERTLLNALDALLVEADKVEKETGSLEVKKASDDLIQMVAKVLLAQALPDLLKEGDIAGAKGVFADLGQTKGQLMLEYQEATRPYYEEMTKMIAANLSILKFSNVVSKEITESDLKNLPRNEIDKIMDKIRKIQDKSFDKDYMLQQEAKYRERYIDPNRKHLEDNMKLTLNDFTKRLNTMIANKDTSKDSMK
jgi:hypothetical protein